MSFIDPRVEWVEQFPYPGTYRGRGQLRAVFEKVLREFDDYGMEFFHFVTSDKLVVVLGAYEVRKNALSRYVQTTFVHAFWLSDSVVVRYEQWLDTDYARNIIGRLRL
jgi:hypothetical protein